MCFVSFPSFQFAESMSTSCPREAIDFDPFLYASLAALVRQLGTDDSPRIFAESLRGTIVQLKNILSSLSEAVRVFDASDMESKALSHSPIILEGVRYLRRLSRAIGALECRPPFHLEGKGAQ